jgi:hypothetical protein
MTYDFFRKKAQNTQRGQPKPKELSHPDSESGDFTDKEELSLSQAKSGE